MRKKFKTQKEVLKYRKRIFELKKECRKAFREESFERKLEIAFELFERDMFLKKFKPVKKD